MTSSSEERTFSFQITENQEEKQTDSSTGSRKNKAARSVTFAANLPVQNSNKTTSDDIKTTIQKTPVKLGKFKKDGSASVGRGTPAVTPTKAKSILINSTMPALTPTKASDRAALDVHLYPDSQISQTPSKELSSSEQEVPPPTAGLSRTPRTRRAVIPSNVVLTPLRVPVNPAELSKSKSLTSSTPHRNIGPPRRVKTPLKLDSVSAKRPSVSLVSPARRVLTPMSDNIRKRKQITPHKSISTPRRVPINSTAESPNPSPKMRILNQIKKMASDVQRDSSQEKTTTDEDKNETERMEESNETSEESGDEAKDTAEKSEESSEAEESSDDEGSVSLGRFSFRTPHLSDVVSASAQTNQAVEKIPRSAEKLPVKRIPFKKAKQSKISKPCNILKNKPSAKPMGPPTLPLSLIRSEFKRFSRCRVSKDLDEVLIQSTNAFFKQICADLGETVDKANRKTIIKEDVIDLMNRQGLVSKEKPIEPLIAEYLPLEMRSQLIPMARAYNKIVPASLN